ncbi:MAG: hypothetical protein PWQ91_1592 [Eubacteriales bacterium]|nr:hypothetical protein [Eubacteriales bacterium]MDN5364530.1 hypothetical protein [Eubacteriales bacterium]
MSDNKLWESHRIILARLREKLAAEKEEREKEEKEKTGPQTRS